MGEKRRRREQRRVTSVGWCLHSPEASKAFPEENPGLASGKYSTLKSVASFKAKSLSALSREGQKVVGPHEQIIDTGAATFIVIGFPRSAVPAGAAGSALRTLRGICQWHGESVQGLAGEAGDSRSEGCVGIPPIVH